MEQSTSSDGPKLTFIGKFIVLVIVAACFGGAYYLYQQRRAGPTNSTGAGASSAPSSEPPATPGAATTSPSATPVPPAPGQTVEFGIAYGTEKKRWLEYAVEAFGKSPAGAGIRVNLIPMGSLEGAQAVLRGDDAAKRIHVWSPASALYKDVFVQEWTVKHSQNPIAREEALALSPMVFVFWDERYQAFIQKYKEVSFKTIGQALSEKGGWNDIAKKPEWGVFKFGHTHPNESNSGLMTLVLMAYDFHERSRDLAMKDVLDAGFNDRMDTIERGVTGMSNSTGNMMRDMVLKGPSSYDVLFVYESVVIDYLRNAEGRWGKLHVEYPRYNMWNDNPYYVLDVPWSSAEQRKAAQKFAEFLLTEPVQKQSLTHGFRPGNPAVPIKFPESPFVLFEPFGLRIDLTTVCEPPKAEVVNNLLLGWQRRHGSR